MLLNKAIDAMDIYKNLTDKIGEDFDKSCSEMRVEHFVDAIELYKKAAFDCESPENRAWAAEKFTGLEAHLKHAEECKERSSTL